MGLKRIFDLNEEPCPIPGHFKGSGDRLRERQPCLHMQLCHELIKAIDVDQVHSTSPEQVLQARRNVIFPPKAPIHALRKVAVVPKEKL